MYSQFILSGASILCLSGFYTFFITLAKKVTKQPLQVNRDQKSDQEALEQCHYRKNELLARQKHLEDKKRSLRERLTQLDDYIK